MVERKLITIRELSEILHLSVPYIDVLIRKEEIPSYKIGKKRLFHIEEILEWLREKRCPTRTEKEQETKCNTLNISR
jgi:excisionase family DNA binding protein